VRMHDTARSPRLRADHNTAARANACCLLIHAETSPLSCPINLTMIPQYHSKTLSSSEEAEKKGTRK